MNLDAARRVADAVLYEGYLLYPYRASAAKNRSRWQFGVLGPPAAASAAFAEPASMSTDCLLSGSGPDAAVTVRVRFLQWQAREARDGSDRPVDRLTVAGQPVLSWDEAIEHEITLPPVPLSGPGGPGVAAAGPAVGGPSVTIAGDDGDFSITVAGGAEEEPLGAAGRIVRRRRPLAARVRTAVTPDGDLVRLSVRVSNEHPGPVTTKQQAVRYSLLGTHLLIEARAARFVSLQDPPPAAAAAARRCRSDRCWPVLAGSDAVLLCAPIILYDHPEVAAESPGELFDSTEIDELLTLRVLTMTEAEKAEARATDPRARAIVDRCDAMSPAALRRLHGARRPVPGAASGSVLIGGVRIGRDSLVRVCPSRRADAQDLFFAGRVARVTAVLADVDGATHVAVVLVDDPAADLHDWYGRYLYFGPEELQPLDREATGWSS